MRGILAAAGLEELEDAATLLTSELVTNAVLHARSAAELVVRVDGRRLWVGVADGMVTAPVRKNYGPQAGTGRGILLVEHVASAWGTEASDDGKVVWFELVAADDVPGSGSSVSALSGAGPQLFGRVEQEPGGRRAHRARPRGPTPTPRRPLRSMVGPHPVDR